MRVGEEERARRSSLGPLATMWMSRDLSEQGDLSSADRLGRRRPKTPLSQTEHFCHSRMAPGPALRRPAVEPRQHRRDGGTRLLATTTFSFLGRRRGLRRGTATARDGPTTYAARSIATIRSTPLPAQEEVAALPRLRLRSRSRSSAIRDCLCGSCRRSTLSTRTGGTLCRASASVLAFPWRRRSTSAG